MVWQSELFFWMNLEIVGAVQYAKRLPCLVNNGNSSQCLTDGGKDIEWNDLAAWLRIKSFVYQKSFWTSSKESNRSSSQRADKFRGFLPIKKKRFFLSASFVSRSKNFKVTQVTKKTPVSSFRVASENFQPFLFEAELFPIERTCEAVGHSKELKYQVQVKVLWCFHLLWREKGSFC